MSDQLNNCSKDYSHDFHGFVPGGDATEVEKARELMKNTAASDVSTHEGEAQSA